MKKVAAILLLLFYIASSTGVAIKAHYCCGQLKSINFLLNSSGSNKDCKKGCCGDKFAFYKVDDSKNATTVVTFCPSFDKIYYQVSYIVNSSFDPYANSCTAGPVCKAIDPPPAEDINIFIRVLRI
jgi:hypothetical protein